MNIVASKKTERIMRVTKGFQGTCDMYPGNKGTWPKLKGNKGTSGNRDR